MDTIFPKPLQKGDTIALVAPASVPKKESIERFCAEWEKDYRIIVGDSVFERNGYLAGTDDQRAADLMNAFTNPKVAAIFAVRGGYGAGRMTDLLDFNLIAANPKIFAGFSDVTYLHSALNRLCNLVTFHTPHPNDGLDPLCLCQATKKSFIQSMTTPVTERLICDSSMADLKTITPGKATGRLTGGNLAVLASAQGTRYAPDLAGKILFLEDAAESPYRIDRFLSQMRLAGDLDEVAGVLLGHFTDCVSRDAEENQSTHEVLGEYLASLGVPMLVGFPAGHAFPNLSIPMHAMIEIDADAKTVRIASNQ